MKIIIPFVLQTDIDKVTEKSYNESEDLELKEDIILELNAFPHILQFIHKCQCHIKQQSTLIAKLQEKIEKLVI